MRSVLSGLVLLAISAGAGEPADSEPAARPAPPAGPSLRIGQVVAGKAIGRRYGNALPSLLLHARAETTMNVVPEPVVLENFADERLGDRAQVILVVTGLGAPTLEDTLAGIEDLGQHAPATLQPTPVEQEIIETQPIPIELARTPFMAHAMTDLDLPAFMRRSERYSDNGDQDG